MTDPERLIYAAAFVASIERNFYGPEPMSYQDAANLAATDGDFAVEMLRDAKPTGRNSRYLLAAFRGDATST
jgi:hypothetical protein